MAIQTCFPLSIELWIWRIEPQIIEFLPKSINIFWGGVRHPRPCVIDCDYLELVEFNQPYWFSIVPFCVCGKLLYYGSLFEKDRHKNWILREQSLIDFEISPDNLQMAHSRFYGNENGRPRGITGCSITYPFDTRSSLVSFQQQLSTFTFESENAIGDFSDFCLFNDDIEINCDAFLCTGREPGWYFQLVLLDVLPDILPPDQPSLPSNP